MRTIFAIFVVSIFSSLAMATDVCSVLVRLENNVASLPDYSSMPGGISMPGPVSGALAIADCTRSQDSKNVVVQGSHVLTSIRAKNAAVKYLLDLGYTPIDSTTFAK